MKEYPYTFEQVDGVWKIKENFANFLFEQRTVFGAYPEFTIDRFLKKLVASKKMTLDWELVSWEYYCKKNKIDISKYKQEWIDRKDELMPLMKKLAEELKNEDI